MDNHLTFSFRYSRLCAVIDWLSAAVLLIGAIGSAVLIADGFEWRYLFCMVVFGALLIFNLNDMPRRLMADSEGVRIAKMIGSENIKAEDIQSVRPLAAFDHHKVRFTGFGYKVSAGLRPMNATCVVAKEDIVVLDFKRPNEFTHFYMAISCPSADIAKRLCAMFEDKNK